MKTKMKIKTKIHFYFCFRFAFHFRVCFHIRFHFRFCFCFYFQFSFLFLFLLFIQLSLIFQFQFSFLSFTMTPLGYHRLLITTTFNKHKHVKEPHSMFIPVYYASSFFQWILLQQKSYIAAALIYNLKICIMIMIYNF